jgi:hypothetical protein
MTMSWTELKPGRAGVERVRMSRMRHGTALLSMSAPVAARNGLKAGVKCRLLVNMDVKPRALRIVVDADGPYAVRMTRGGGVCISVGKLPGLHHIAFELTDCEWDEMVDDKKRVVVEVELPQRLQAPDRVPAVVPSIAAQNGARR